MDVPALDGGDFRNLTITKQLDIVSAALAGEEADLIGSSLGGYVAALYAARHANIRRVILLAPAFGFRSLWEEELGPERMRTWQGTGELHVFHYAAGENRALGYGLMEDARRYERFPDCGQPMLIFHGEHDDVVPCELSREYAGKHPNAILRALPSGHELTDVLEVMWPEMLTFLSQPGSPGGC